MLILNRLFLPFSILLGILQYLPVRLGTHKGILIVTKAGCNFEGKLDVKELNNAFESQIDLS